MRSIAYKVKRQIQRKINQKHVNDYPEVSYGWKKFPGNPILGDIDTGTLFDPFVRIVDGKYVMHVSRRKDFCIMQYSSTDGVTWNDAKIIMSGVENSKWETKVNRGCFIVRNGMWHLWYTGQTGDESKIGYAKSSDGVNFERCKENPIMVPELAYEGNALMNPCVIWDEKRKIYRMWYAAGENYEPDVICYAESKDGIDWKKRNTPVMQPDKDILYKRYKVGACDVVKINEKEYIMAYIAYQNLDIARIALAVSDDGGIIWKDVFSQPVLGPGEGKWDGHAVYKPTLCLAGDKMFMWYNGRFSTTEKIGMAFCGKFDSKDGKI